MLENAYTLVLVLIFALSILDLVVGVGNDAINFLSPAVGSGASSFKRILIISSLGIFLGAITSGGMMEIARKGIFNPDMFTFSDVMIIFISVIITDVLLINFYNIMGFPTSTTVSLVFELLGASFTFGLLKIITNSGNYIQVLEYINTKNAFNIIVGIFSSIGIAFILGSLTQYISRLIFTFNYENKMKKYGAFFSSICISFIAYFVLIKGFKNTSFIDTKFIIDNYLYVIGICLILFYVVSYIIINFTKINILKIVVLIGTFSIAMSFASNDLVNFIGVALGGLKAYSEFMNSNLDANVLHMGALSEKVSPPFFILSISGIIMIMTLKLSKKAKRVLNTGINLSSENENVNEKFDSNIVSRFIVRISIKINDFFMLFIPIKTRVNLRSRLQKPSVDLPNNKIYEKPAFDLVRASINLTVASIIISFATNLKLPLSTTYVTFMVGMGSSLADGAWGRDNAVYRIAGVVNVIAGWFATAIIAFISCGIVAVFINYTGLVGILIFTVLIIIVFLRKSKSIEESISNSNVSNKDIQDLLKEIQYNTLEFFRDINKIYFKTIEGGILEKRLILKENKKILKIIEEKLEELKNRIFYFLRIINNHSTSAGREYVNLVDKQRRILRYIERIHSNMSYHIDNNLRSFSKRQISVFEDIRSKVVIVFDKTEEIVDKKNFDKLPRLEELIIDLKSLVTEKINERLDRIHKENISHKNTELYISVLLDTKGLLSFIEEAMISYKNFWKEILDK